MRPVPAAVVENINIVMGGPDDGSGSRDYVAADPQIGDDEPLENNMWQLIAALCKQQAEGARRITAITVNLKMLGFGGMGL